MSAGGRDYYEILQVHPKASPEVIQNAYRALVKKYHPDVYTGDKETATKIMALINDAYAVISDPEKRKQYDAFLASKQQTHSSHPEQSPQPHSQRHDTPAEERSQRPKEDISPEMRQVIIARYIALHNNETLLEKPNISLSRVNGIGNIFSGEEDFDLASNSYITNYWFTFLFIPVLLLGRYRVIRKNNSYIIISKVTQRRSFGDTVKAYFKEPAFYIALIAICLLPFFGNTQTTHNNNNTASHHQTQNVTAKPKQPPPNYKPKANVITQYVPGQPVDNDSGYCELTVDNSRNDFPVYVRLWDMNTRSPVRAFTIHQGETFTADKLSPSIYEIRYKQLYEDQNLKNAFKSESFTLTQHQTPTGIEYETVNLTLYKVQNGNTRTYQISEAEL